MKGTKPGFIYLYERFETMKIKTILLNYLNILILVATVLLFCNMVYSFAINVPLADDFRSCLDFMNKFISDKNLHARILLLLSQSNEHRITTTRLIELLYYKIFHEINFRHLIFVADMILILCALPIYFLLKDIIKKNKSGNLAFITIIIILLMSFSQWRELVWIGASLQQFSQLFLSLSCLWIIERYLREDCAYVSLLMALYLILSIMNSFTGGGWIALCIATNIFFIIKKRYSLLAFNTLLYIIIALTFFHFLPYSFAHPPRPSITAYFKFILGFSGSVYFTNQFSYFFGAVILVFLVCNIKIILKYNSLLLWTIFFITNPIIMAFSRAGMDPNFGLASHYSTYSAINLIFVIIIIYLKYFSSQSDSKFLTYIPMFLFLLYTYSYKIYTSPSSETAAIKNYGLTGLYTYSNYLWAKNVYLTSKELGVFSSTMIDYNIQNADKYARSVLDIGPILNNRQSRFSLDEITKIGPNFFSVKGWIFIPETSPTDFSKYIILSNSKNKYIFALLTIKRADVTSFFKSKASLDDAGFNSFISTQNIKPGVYNIHLYTTNHIIGSTNLVNKPIDIK